LNRILYICYINLFSKILYICYINLFLDDETCLERSVMTKVLIYFNTFFIEDVLFHFLISKTDIIDSI